MKKVYWLLAINFLLACEKDTIAPEWNNTYPIRAIDDTVPTQDADITVIDTVIYDAFAYSWYSIGRSGDGFVDIIILGNKFKGRNGLGLFLQAADSAKTALSTIYPMSQYLPYIRFHYRNIKQELGCDDNVSIAEGWVCNQNKVINAALNVADGLFFIDQVVVLAYGDGRGGADGAGICAIGVGIFQNSQSCIFWNGFRGKVRHEFFHNICGMGHPPCIPFNLMCTCGNGCCDIANAPLLPEHQTLVINYINSKIN